MLLRPYQIQLANKGVEVLSNKMIVYYSIEVRCGKTLISLETAKLYGAQRVLFITKKKAISSIENDYKNFGYSFQLTVINYESVHKINGTFDLVIIDEAHKNGAFPKPNTATKLIKQRYGKLPMILLSGTPHPESYSQIYHQFWLSNYSPFTENTFYKWANTYVLKGKIYTSYGEAIDYSKANKKLIDEKIKEYMITFTQQQAGFSTEVKEHILKVKMLNSTYKIADKLTADRIVNGQKETVLADTPVKLLTKLHQIYSGTVKFESGTSAILDLSKAKFIKEKFKNNKIAIFYKFKEEYYALKQIFGDMLTNDLSIFDNSDKHIALQIVSGREGISLKNADYLVYYNIDFSAVSYWQAVIA